MNNTIDHEALICEDEKPKSLKCVIRLKNIDNFIDHVITMKNENKSIEDMLNFEFEFYTEDA